jgi:hypothetical protein
VSGIFVALNVPERKGVAGGPLMGRSAFNSPRQ